MDSLDNIDMEAANCFHNFVQLINLKAYILSIFFNSNYNLKLLLHKLLLNLYKKKIYNQWGETLLHASRQINLYKQNNHPTHFKMKKKAILVQVWIRKLLLPRKKWFGQKKILFLHIFVTYWRDLVNICKVFDCLIIKRY